MRRNPVRWLPCLEWGARYDRASLLPDALAALIVTIMLIPQSLAYALLAGLPPEVGLYASIAPLVAYGIFGTSRTLAVGPVAVVSLMTAAAVGELAAQGTPEYQGAALALAALSGLMLLAMGVLRLGFLANFLSHPVISGFITASAIVIAASQLKHLLGVEAGGHDLVQITRSLFVAAPQLNLPTVAIGVAAIGLLSWARRGLAPWLRARGVAPALASALARTGPVIGVVATTVVSWGLALEQRGVGIVGAVPGGLPELAVPPLEPALLRELVLPALLISVVGFVESVSVAQTLAAKRRQRIVPDQELVALGAANLAAGLSGGYPVTGGFARSVVNHDAGAVTPAAGLLTALGIALATAFLTPALHFLPKATLAATIVVAVLGLVDVGALRRTWAYSKSDFAAMAATIALTLLAGVEIGVVAGVVLSVGLHLHRTSRPHWAVVGQVPGTEHFRNVQRHQVITVPGVLSIRVDESLYFPNARFLEDLVSTAVAGDHTIRDVVLVCSAVNFIDASALESLEAINERLEDAGVRLHLSEVKGPVMDRLGRSDLLDQLSGAVHLSQFAAMQAIAPAVTADMGSARGPPAALA